MMPPGKYFVGLAVFAILATTFFVLPLPVYTDCSSPLVPPPHQGGGKGASADQFVFGIKATITISDPYLGCQDRWDSYTNEWIMVLGPGVDEWIQFGWEKDRREPLVHIWYQAVGPGYLDDQVLGLVTQTRTYSIQTYSDDYGNTFWRLYADSDLLHAIPAADLGWSNGGYWGKGVQWSGEVSYDVSEMGGTWPHYVTFDRPLWQVNAADWAYITTPYTFNSWHSRYHGDAYQYPGDGSWRFRNWTGQATSCTLIEMKARWNWLRWIEFP